MIRPPPVTSHRSRVTVLWLELDRDPAISALQVEESIDEVQPVRLRVPDSFRSLPGAAVLKFAGKIYSFLAPNVSCRRLHESFQQDSLFLPRHNSGVTHTGYAKAKLMFLQITDGPKR